eukprot:CAMPEP_0174738994 /NCGR_PEP_ID=MMETSP1094-20130205/70845_1 /TAXON_ID=156173 /ORGANISM="Chrysochromulina brevifilum, Strain UTEX LB 985" /LENGTH=93 /DNA_ID=CAMNT_0015942501 /DNA_START=144 /DNA_END=426 /DNA_ORIENTATION=+
MVDQSHLAVGILPEERAQSIAAWSSEIIQVEPEISSKLDATLDRQSLMSVRMSDFKKSSSITLGHSTARPSFGVTVAPRWLNFVPPPASTSDR